MEPKIVDEYVKDGTLRIEWHDFPYLGQESVNAALAARAAGEQGKFWEYNHILYENQDGENNGGFSDENLLAFARKLDLDTEQFQRDMTGERLRNAVADDFEEAQQRGISGTPTFIVNGRTIVGFQDFETFSGVIDEAKRQANDG